MTTPRTLKRFSSAKAVLSAFSLIAMNSLIIQGHGMESRTFTGLDCRIERKIFGVTDLNLNFSGKYLEIHPSEDDYTYIKTDGNKAPLKELQFEKSSDGTLLSLVGESSAGGSVTQIINDFSGSNIIQSMSIGGSCTTFTSGFQDNKPVDIARHIKGNIMSSGIYQINGLTLKNFYTQNGKIERGEVAGGEMLYKGVVYPKGSVFKNGVCTSNPSAKLTSNDKREQQRTKAIEERLYYKFFLLSYPNYPLPTDVLRIIKHSLIDTLFTIEKPVPLRLIIKTPITTSVTLNTSAEEIKILQLNAALNLDLNKNCIANVGSLLGKLTGKLYGNSSLTVEDYRGGSSLNFDLNGHSKTEISRKSSTVSQGSSDLTAKTFGSSEFILSGVDLGDVEFDLNGSSRINLFPNAGVISDLLAKTFEKSTLTIVGTPKKSKLNLNGSSDTTIIDTGNNLITDRLTVKTYEKSQLCYGDVKNAVIDTNGSSQVKIGADKGNILEDFEATTYEKSGIKINQAVTIAIVETNGSSQIVFDKKVTKLKQKKYGTSRVIERQ